MSSFLPLQLLEKLYLNAALLCLFFLSLIFLYKWVCSNNPTTHENPPSPPKLPIIGNLHQLGKCPHQSLQSLSLKYGELMLLHLGSKPTLVVSSANAAREIMKTHDLIFSNRPYLRNSGKLSYNRKDVAFANYGEYWRDVKSICVLQLLSNKRVRSFRSIREEETTLMVEKIKKSGAEAVNLSEIFITLTNNVVCRAAFGKKYGGEERINFKEVFQEFVELLGTESMGDFIPWLGWIDEVNGSGKKLDKVAERFDRLLEGVLEEHLHGFDVKGHGDEDDKGEKMKDFVDVLIEVQRETKNGHSIDRESIKAVVLDMFAGGTDTSYTAIEWAMSELLKHPIVLNKLQQEVRSVAQGKAGIKEDDLEKIPYLKAVIKETFRLHPPLPLLVFRESTDDVKINGYDIAARTQVIVNAWAIQRDPSIWEDPEVFCPERFLTSSIDFKGHDFQLIPFGAGRRSCPGIAFAIASVELVLATLMYEFDWALPGGTTGETLNMDEAIGLVIHRRSPLLAVATPYCCQQKIDDAF